MSKKIKHTNYDSFTAIAGGVKDDKLRFPFIASCVLAGSLEVEDCGAGMFMVDDEKYRITAASRISEKTGPVLYAITSDSNEKLSDLVARVTNEYSARVKSTVKAISQVTDLRTRPKNECLYTISLAFGYFVDSSFMDNALKELGQRSEQRIIALYKNQRLKTESNNRSPQELDKCFLHEYSYFFNSIQDVMRRYI